MSIGIDLDAFEREKRARLPQACAKAARKPTQPSFAVRRLQLRGCGDTVELVEEPPASP